jgi:hypothetical protein
MTVQPLYPLNVVKAAEAPQSRGIAKWFLPALAVLALAALIGSGYLVYSRTQPPAETPAQQPVVKDETADWKVYTNYEYGFELQYPKYANYKVTPLVSSYRIVFTGSSVNFELYIDKESTELALEEYSYLNLVKDSEATLGGQKALVFKAPQGYCKGSVCGLPFIAYSTKSEKNFYNLIFYGDTQLSKDEETILTNFRLLKAGPAGESQSWKIYSNTDLGVSFKYPVTFQAYTEAKEYKNYDVENQPVGKSLQIRFAPANPKTTSPFYFSASTPDYNDPKDPRYTGVGAVENLCEKPLSYSAEGNVCAKGNLNGTAFVKEIKFVRSECTFLGLQFSVKMVNTAPSPYKGLEFRTAFIDANKSIDQWFDCVNGTNMQRAFAEGVAQSQNLMNKNNLSQTDFRNLETFEKILASFEFLSN